MYNGDTSIYCPVSFANGKLSIGSTKYTAIYRNRYYHMSSSKHLGAFVSNPNKYASFPSAPRLYPKPKISVMSPFGVDVTDLTGNLSDTFDLIRADSYGIFEQQVLPEFAPMPGKMYEEPTLKKYTEQYFVSHGAGYVDGLRKYIDRESGAYLNGSDWAKMNAPFSRTDGGGICYTNYPRNSTELRYLIENGIGPDAIVEVVADVHEVREHAKKAVAANFSTYQDKLINSAVAWNRISYRNTVAQRSVVFKSKIAGVLSRRKIDEFKMLTRRAIETIAAEAVSEPVEETNEGPSELWRDFTCYPSAKLLPGCSGLTLKQKKTIIKYGLNVGDFVGLDDFNAIESICRTVEDELPLTMIPIVKFCSQSPSVASNDTWIDRCLEVERSALADMRKFAKLSGVPWIVKSVGDAGSTELGDIIAKGDGIFETTFAVDLETCENLLRTGELYLSRFGRWCPVQVGENPYGSVQQFHSDCAKGHAVYPVVHRKYVYFLRGRGNRDRFVGDPLKYAFRPFTPPVHHPLRIAVIGPPGSGKSYSARKLSDRYGLELIRIEQVVEDYLKTYWWTDESKSASRQLRSGGALSDTTLVEAVKSAVHTTLAVVQGYVLDGFPNTQAQFELMDGSGIIFHRVFVANMDGPPDGNRNDGPASLSVRRHRAWTEAFVGREWIAKRYGNVTELSTDDRTMEDSVAICVEALRQYSKNVTRNKPCRLASVPVVEREIVDRMTAFSDLCSVCKVQDDLTTRPGTDEDLRSGLVQYGWHFYWTCPGHRETFAGDPDRYADMVPAKPEVLPTTVPPDRWSVERYFAGFTGYCAVCALRRLWNPAYKSGLVGFMAEYRRHTFAFCSETCRRDFMSRPEFYRRHGTCAGPPEEPGWSRSIAVDDLPVPGYLEQTVGNPVASALVRLTAVRPVYPGHSVECSAALFLGLCVGTNGSDADTNEYYRETFERFAETCRRFRTEVFKLKSISCE